MSKLVEIKVESNEDNDKAKEIRDSARVQHFGSATFECRTKPSTQQLAARIVGAIVQSRRKYWVVSKPNRQIGDEPRDRITISIDPGVARATRSFAEQRQITLSTVAEDALRDYLGLDDSGNP